MSSRLPLGWSKLLEGLPKAQVAVEGVIQTEELQVEGKATIHRTAVDGKTIILRMETHSSGHFQPKVFSQLPAAPSVELS
jgi:hypothetical protein